MRAFPSYSLKLANPTPLAFLPFRLSWAGMHISPKQTMNNPMQWISQILSILNRERNSRRLLSVTSILMLCETRKSTGLLRNSSPKTGVSCTSPDWGATKGTLMILPSRIRASIFLLRAKWQLLEKKKKGRQWSCSPWPKRRKSLMLATQVSMKRDATRCQWRKNRDKPKPSSSKGRRLAPLILERAPKNKRCLCPNRTVSYTKSIIKPRQTSLWPKLQNKDLIFLSSFLTELHYHESRKSVQLMPLNGKTLS